MSNPIIPRVHLNGTNKGELMQQCQDAVEALRAAQEALARMAPHGRDYYVLGGDIIGHALDDHAARQKKLRSVLEEVETIWQGICDQPVNFPR